MELVFESGYDNTKPKSLFVRTTQANFLFDCFSEFFDRFNENLNGVVISSKENINGINRLRSWVNNHDVDKMPVYLEKDTLTELSKNYGSEFINPIIIEPGKPFKLIGTNIEVIPFKIGDSLGFRFNNIVYGKSGEIKPNSEKYVYSARVMFITSDTKDSLKMANKYRPQVCVFSKEDLTDTQIKLSWKLMSGYRGTELITAKNNSMLEIGRTLTQNLMESKKAMSISSVKCLDIIKGNKSLIIMDKLEKDRSGTFTYLIDNSKCYGVIKLGTPYKINISDFKELKSEHLISEEERKKWWPTKEILFVYPFELIDSFNIPRQVILTDKNEITEFMSSVQTKPEDDPLWGDVKLFDQLSDAKIIKDFICVSGSYIAKRDNHVPDDVDIIIKMKDPPEYLKRSIEVRVGRMFKYPEKMHFVWDDSASPFDSFVPLYDLKLERIKETKMVKMSEEIIIPMKPSKKFYDLDELEKNVEDNKKYAVEKKYDGFRAVLVKLGSRTKLYTEQGKEITNVFPTIVSQATDITGKDIILDGELVIKGGSRSEMARFIDKIKKNEPADDSGVTYEVFDCIKLGDKDLTDQPWFVRKANLHNLSFKRSIKEVDSILVSNKSELIRAVELVRKLNQSEGAMVKDYEGTYTLNGESEAWIKFRNRDDLIVKIIKPIETENGFTYTVGIPVSEKVKINEKYLVDGNLRLGNTFVTKDIFKENDAVKISVEEIWRHEYDDQTISYSIHKPSLIGISELGYSTVEDLDKLVVSKGELVIEHSEGATTTSSPGISSIQGTQIKGPKGEKWPTDPEDYFKNTEELTESGVDNHDYFKTWSNEMAYYLGFLTTDGNLDNKTNRIEFYISKEDIEILEGFSKKLGGTVAPKLISGYAALRFKSKEMADDLRELGMDVKKSGRTVYEKVPTEHKWDFARGTFDADGTVNDDRIQYDSSNKNYVTFIENQFKEVVDDVKRYDYGIMGKVVVMKSNAQKVLDKLYSRKPYLSRKGDKKIKELSQEIVENTIVQQENKWCLLDHLGKTTHCFDTYKEALAMERAIQVSKHQVNSLNFEVSNLNIQQLIGFWKSLVEEYISKKSESSSVEDIINLAFTIYREIIKRDTYKFEPDKMEENELELYRLVSKGETGLEDKCFKCKGKCCQFYALGTDQANNLKSGVNLSEFKGVKEDLINYFNYHTGTSIFEDKVYIDDSVRLEDLGNELTIIHSKCSNLNQDGKCNIYESRPQICKDFNDTHCKGYMVPKGCKYNFENTFELDSDKIDEEGGTREETASKFWEDNWQDYYPTNGTGKFIYHHHFRGLNEEESKKDELDLMDTNHSLHGDIRFEKDKDSLFGITVFIGTTHDNKKLEGDKLEYMSKNKGEEIVNKLQVSFKNPQPHSWLDVGKEKPFVSGPGGVGSTSLKFAKFFVEDTGEYEAGTWRKHFFEFFIKGNKLNGRMIVTFAPVGGSRKWLVEFPVDQKSYNQTHKKEEIISELKSKNQKYLLWKEENKPVERIEIT